MDKTFCIFGDSVTQAAYVKVGWVDLLRVYLEQKHKNSFVNVFNLGIGGNTTQDVLERIDSESKVRKPSSVIFAVGVNDCKNYDINQFKINIEKLIEKALNFNNDIVFVGLVLGNYGGSEGFSKDKVVKYNSVINELSKGAKLKFVDLFDKLESSDFMDGLHPNDQGHIKMFEEIKKYL
ncbi:hypothetical protein BH10PAT1_BH10PAT1_5390 [soil metagenome]